MMVFVLGKGGGKPKIFHVSFSFSSWYGTVMAQNLAVDWRFETVGEPPHCFRHLHGQNPTFWIYLARKNPLQLSKVDNVRRGL